MSTLGNLEGLIKACRKRYDTLPQNIELNIPSPFWDKFKPVYENTTNDKIIFNGAYSFVIQNSTASEVAEISTRWMLYAYAFSPFYLALSKYSKISDDIFNTIGINALRNDLKKKVLKNIPSPTWEVDVDNERAGTAASIITQIDTIFSSNLKSQGYFKNFLSNPDWWNLGNTKGKTFDRSINDWRGSAIKAAARVIQNNADRLPGIISVVANNSEIRLALRELITQQAKVTRALNAMPLRNTGARNVIYYGAPGTGKSYRIRNDAKSTNPNLVVTTVFHADTQSSDFIGSFRPTVADNKLGYQFQPGPFTNAFVSAVNNPAEMHYLIIEGNYSHPSSFGK